MIDTDNIIRLAGDGYAAQDIRRLTRLPVAEIRRVCNEAGVQVKGGRKRQGPFITVVKNSPVEPVTAPPRAPDPVPPPTKVNPVLFAFNWLGGRIKEKPSGYWLDDLPVGLDEMVRAANKVARAAGAEMCLHSLRWKP